MSHSARIPQVSLGNVKARIERRGFSLLEMVMATALVIGVLAPALAVVRDAMASSRTVNYRNLLANYAVFVMEKEIAATATSWTTGSTYGDLASEGHSQIRYSVTKTDETSGGGIEDQLMHIHVSVFFDEDSDAYQDEDELSVTYRTKVANLESYHNAAQ